MKLEIDLPAKAYQCLEALSKSVDQSKDQFIETSIAMSLTMSLLPADDLATIHAIFMGKNTKQDKRENIAIALRMYDLTLKATDDERNQIATILLPYAKKEEV